MKKAPDTRRVSPSTRPAKFSLEVQERICALIRVGNTVDVAAAAIGISPQTIYHWRREREGFRLAIAQARVEAEVGLESQLARAARRGSWQAAATLLERHFPERWAPVSARGMNDRRRRPDRR